MQYLQIEGLDHIVVSAVFESQDNIAGIAPDGKKDDRQFFPVGADPSA